MQPKKEVFKGDSGLEKHVDKLYELSEYFIELLEKHPNFELVLQKVFSLFFRKNTNFY
jgi:glutamate/tyrosine decarboxylase-like PLP-dependent enzyme